MAIKVFDKRFTLRMSKSVFEEQLAFTMVWMFYILFTLQLAYSHNFKFWGDFKRAFYQDEKKNNGISI